MKTSETLRKLTDALAPTVGNRIVKRLLGELVEQVESLEQTQAVCMCGRLVREHTMYCGHTPVDMPEGPCPDENPDIPIDPFDTPQ